MSRDDPSARVREPMVAEVDCGDARHRISWRGGVLAAIDHDEDAERALSAFGGHPPYCLGVLHEWSRPDVDLVAMLGGDDDHNPRRGGLVRATAGAIPRLWTLPVRLRHRLVLHRAVERGADADVLEMLVELDDGRRALDQRTFRRLAAALGVRPRPASEEEAVLGRFFDGTRLVEIPVKASTRRVVLARLAREFTAGREYPEKDVKRILGAFHPDHATLRRYLVDEGFLERSAGIYRVRDAG